VDMTLSILREDPTGGGRASLHSGHLMPLLPPPPPKSPNPGTDWPRSVDSTAPRPNRGDGKQRASSMAE
jgi:hypothetical protein